MKLHRFFAKHPVFTVAELDDYLGGNNKNTRNSLLTYHRRSENILPVRRGLYAVVTPGASAETASLDPYLLASKMTVDATLAYHTALVIHGKAYSVYHRFTYLSERPSQPVHFRGYDFRCVVVSKALRKKGKESFGVEQVERVGIPVRVTDLERTLVDALDRPDLCGGWEEVWRSLESIEYVKLDEVAEYVRLLGKSTTAAKVGFFLQQHADALMVDDKQLGKLRKLAPRQPHYLDRSRRGGGTFLSEWNLIVPEAVIKRSWAEVT
ncbi:MAG: transcriptional regulator [Actinobacteria bacterium]|nr:transcriptional regulator [Actinomycetota bacterium]